MQNWHLWLPDCIYSACSFPYKRQGKLGFGFASYKENILIWAHDSSEIKRREARALEPRVASPASRGRSQGWEYSTAGLRLESSSLRSAGTDALSLGSCGVHSVPISFLNDWDLSITSGLLPGCLWMHPKLTSSIIQHRLLSFAEAQ